LLGSSRPDRSRPSGLDSFFIGKRLSGADHESPHHGRSRIGGDFQPEESPRSRRSGARSQGPSRRNPPISRPDRPESDDRLQGGLDPSGEPQGGGSGGSRRGQYRRGGGDRPKDRGRECTDRKHHQRRRTRDRPDDFPPPAPSGGGPLGQGRQMGKEEARGPRTVREDSRPRGIGAAWRRGSAARPGTPNAWH